MGSENQSEMIERYILNLMGEEEKKKFELLLQEDPSLIEEVKIQKQLLDLASDEDFHSIFTPLKTGDKVYHENLIKSRKNKKILLFFLLVLVFLILLYFISQKMGLV
jgi:hypothetical protein